MSEVADRLNEALKDRYRIERKLGEGGMATVWLAEDLRHDRRVAIKVLRPALAAVVGAQRFLGEIKTTAALQHPHILALHDSGEADGFLFYVMPYVQGESLSERLARERQLPVDEAVELARKLADALDYAHGQGVVHRDVKPANVLLSERGEPLVADFGIALAVQQAGKGRLTETGMSLGTPYYMSPEQATGDRDPDARSDVYSLGCVLYEMLAGEPPFTGPTSQAVLARILTDAARPLSEVRRTVPPHVNAAAARSIEKLPADRFASAQDLRSALADPSFTHEPAATSGGPTRLAGVGRRAPPSPRWGAFAALGSLVLLLAGFLIGRAGVVEPRRPVIRFSVVPPEEVRGVSMCCGPSEALSPDGEWLVFVGVGGPGDPLYRRRLGELDAEVIRGTVGASSPFFSPDSRWIGFTANGRLQKIPVSGGPPVPITEVSASVMASWGDNDVIVFAHPLGSLHTIPATGGAVATPVPDTDDYILPWMLPGGEAALARIESAGAYADDRFVVVDLETGGADTLGVATKAVYGSGHLVLSTAEGTLLAQPFDPEARRTTGEAIAILDGVDVDGPSVGEFTVSADGSLVYQTDTGGGFDETLVIRGGETTADVPLSERGRSYESPVFSPDGRRVAVTIFGEGGLPQVWIWDRDQRTQQLLTVEGENNQTPVWSPDGARIAFTGQRDDSDRQLYWQPVDGSGAAVRLPEVGSLPLPGGFSPDGRSLVFASLRDGANADVGLLDLGEGTVRWLVETDADEYQPEISPDGRWLAYTSERSDRPEVYVQALDGTGGRVQVSAGGGHSARWAPDGNTLYYATEEGEPIIGATVRTGDRFRLLSREELFEGPEDLNVPGETNWDVSPDGEEFLYIHRGPVGDAETFVWIVNWPGLLERTEPEGSSIRGWER